MFEMLWGWTGAVILRRKHMAAASLRWCGLSVLLMCLSACVSLVAHEAQSQLDKGQPEAALAILAKAIKDHPESAELRTMFLRTRDDQINDWLSQAEQARLAGKYDGADRLLARVLELDPNHARAKDQQQALMGNRLRGRQLQEAQALMQRGQPAGAVRLLDEALKAMPADVELSQLRRQALAAQRDRAAKAARIGLAERRPITLDFRDAGLRQVLDLVTRYSGLNFVLDKDIRQDLRLTLYLKNVTVDDALDLIVSTHQLGRKVLDERTVLLYPNTPDKLHEYQEQVVRVFYLASADAKGAAAFLRSMLKLKDPFVDERSNMLALRESPEIIALAERLIGLYDTQEPEVMLELQVLELRTTRLTELGVQVPSSVTLTPLSTGGSGLTLASIRNIGRDQIGVSIGGVTVNLRRETGDFEILANPRVRAKNKEKAKVMIGDKLPIITTTTSQTGFVSDSVSYLDVGLKLEVEPTVFANDEVMVRLSLEVSQLASQLKTASGTVAYQINTRNANTALRLRDGETQLLAGLLSREDRNSASKIPLLGDVPMLGRLFSSQTDDGSRTELVLAVTPHIVRNLRLPDAAEAELWVGTDAYTRLRNPFAINLPEASSSTRGGDGATPKVDTGADPSTNQESADSLGSPSSSAGGRMVLPPPVSMRWQAPPQAHAGEVFEVSLMGDLAEPLRGFTLQAHVNPGGGTKLVGTAPGGLFTEDNAQVSNTAAVDPQTSLLSVGVLRSDASVVSGQGEIARLKFQVNKPGTFTLSDPQVQPISLRKQLPSVVLPPLVIQVQP